MDCRAWSSLKYFSHIADKETRCEREEQGLSDPDKKAIDEIALPSLEAPPVSDLQGDTLLSDGNTGVFSHVKLAALEAIIGLLTRDYKFDEFCRELLLVFMKAVKSEAGSLLEVNHEAKRLFFRSAAGYSSDKVSRFEIPLGEGVAGHAVKSRQPVLVQNANESKEHLRAIAKAVGFEVRELVAVPVVVRGTVFGVLELLNKSEGTYSTEDVELLSYLCSIAAQAIEVRLMISWVAQRKAA